VLREDLPRCREIEVHRREDRSGLGSVDQHQGKRRFVKLGDDSFRGSREDQARNLTVLREAHGAAVIVVPVAPNDDLDVEPLADTGLRPVVQIGKERVAQVGTNQRHRRDAPVARARAPG